MSIQIMLGPQSPRTNLKDAIDSLSINGPVVSITAGWRDSEAEIDELQSTIGSPIKDLNLYQMIVKKTIPLLCVQLMNICHNMSKKPIMSEEINSMMMN